VCVCACVCRWVGGLVGVCIQLSVLGIELGYPRINEECSPHALEEQETHTDGGSIQVDTVHTEQLQEGERWRGEGQEKTEQGSEEGGESGASDGVLESDG